VDKWFLWVNKGLFVGFLSGCVAVLHSVRNGQFKWHIAVPDLISATIVGHATWALTSSIGSIEEWEMLVLTIIMSINSFIVVGFLLNGELLKKYVSKTFGVNFDSNSKKVSLD